MPEADHLLFGRDPLRGVVAVEHRPGAAADAMRLFVREGGATRVEDRPFRPFLWATAAGLLDGAPEPSEGAALDGANPLRHLATFATWKALDRVVAWLRQTTGETPASPDAPYLALNDPVQQFLLASGIACFKGMGFGELRRLQLDIETATEEGFEFPNPEREGDRILAIGLADSSGWSATLAGEGMTERELIERFVALVRERDPDVIEGYNLFAFDLPYLAARARRHRVRLALGRDGSAPRVRPGRFTAADRTVNYPRADVHGRSVVDVYFLAQLHDAGQRSLPGLGLKEVARHFGLARPDRTYLEGPEIGRVFARDPARVLAYLRDDVRETQGLADLLEPVYFAQAQVLPFGFQNVCVRGNAAKIDALLLRAYRHAGRAVARPDPPRPFEGGYTDIFERGVIRNVHHCDVRSLYPSLMLARRIGPASDDLGAFLELLRYLRDRRLAAKERARRAASPEDRRNEDARQGTLKILINSFYGYLGFSAARFSDFSAAERVTAAGREVLRHMVEWIRGHGGRPVEIDTDGVYFVPPDESAPGAREAFRRELAASLPEGIEVEFDGEYESMFSYRMKNYALLAPGGEVLLRGAALRSRGLEPFQRDYMREAIGLLLRGREAELPGLRRRYRGDIEQRRWPVARLAKTERLQDAPETYRGKVGAKGRGRNAAYELALASGRPYRAGDTLSYYVSGTRKSVAVFEAAKLVSAWDPAARDENVAYYAAKLEALANKFEAMVHPGDDPAQGQLDLGEGGRAGGDGEGGGDEA